MADNTTVDNGALADYTVSTDEGVGGHVQRVKLAYSADGSETHVSASADGLMVSIGAAPTLAVSNAGLTELAAAIDTEMQVDIVSPGTSATSLGKAEDAVHASGDVGVYALAVRDTAPAAHSGADGDYESLHVSDEGGLWSAEVASSQGGCAVFRSIDLDETEEDVKTSAGSLYGWHITNTATSTRFVKLYNATAANVVVGTTTPVMTIPVAGNASDDISANMAFTPGIRFDTAICAAATTGVADNDTGAPGLNEVIVNFFYK